jgi:hypothetical protein
MYDTSLYNVDDTHGHVYISKPIGGTQTLQMLHVRFRPVVSGDFDVSVDFWDAEIDRVSGRPGNQVQLNATFGGQTLSVVRSDEVYAGHNHHVWEDPPQVWWGEQPDTTSRGTFRIMRSGTTVSCYYRGVLVHSGDYNAEDVTFLSFSLQNNGTTDATQVRFDDFRITADALYLEYPSAVKEQQAPPIVSIVATPNPFSGGTRVEYSLESEGLIRLEVYDVAGRLVALLDEGWKTPGAHTAVWDGRDAHDTDVPSGVYFARLEFERQTFAHKLTLIR